MEAYAGATATSGELPGEHGGAAPRASLVLFATLAKKHPEAYDEQD